MNSNTVIVLSSFILAYFVAFSAGDEKNSDWWKHAVFYQIYPRSFKDSNDDGVGDLQGIISKLEHFKDAGVTATWLSPIYKSPQVDQGYDISDYRDIHYEYGTIADVEELIQKAHALGVKIIMDFVPNHTSDEHEWFKKSEQNEEGYSDYYVWRDGVDGGPPNNWLTLFKNSAWTYSDIRKQYYLHQFTKQQPDLNYRNPAVVQAMKDVLTFWLEKGIDGFRIDAVPYLFEDTEFRDEPKSGNSNANPIDYEYLSHIYTSDLDETFDMIYQWRTLIDEYSESHDGDIRVLMTEAYTDINNTMKYYGDATGSKLGAHFAFNFQFITNLKINSKVGDIITCVNTWLNHMPNIYIPNWVLGNHDNRRVTTRLGVENADGYNMLVALLPGVQVTYNGEEIGMEDGEVTYAQGQDPSACNLEEEYFESVSRDFERTPFHWDSTKNAGFSNADSTWLPVSSKYLTNNLALQSEEGVKSNYHVYQELIKLRSSSVPLKQGDFFISEYSDTVLMLKREYDNEKVILVFNIGNDTQSLKLENLDEQLTVLIPSSKSSRLQGATVQADQFSLAPHESLVLYQKIDSTSNDSTTTVSTTTASTTTARTTTAGTTTAGTTTAGTTTAGTTTAGTTTAGTTTASTTTASTPTTTDSSSELYPHPIIYLFMWLCVILLQQ